MATKKAGGSTNNGRDSQSKRLGVKKYGGQHVNTGMILVRQRGFKVFPGSGTFAGKDHTLHAAHNGIVKYSYNKFIKKTVINVLPITTLL